MPAAAFQQRQLSTAVDVQIGERVVHAAEMAHLRGQAEDDVLHARQDAQALLIAEIGNVDANLPADRLDVVGVAAVGLDQ